MLKNEEKEIKYMPPTTMKERLKIVSMRFVKRKICEKRDGSKTRRLL